MVLAAWFDLLENDWPLPPDNVLWALDILLLLVLGWPDPCKPFLTSAEGSPHLLCVL